MTENDSALVVSSRRPSLKRVLDPKTVAMVGVSENSEFAKHTLRTAESDADVYLVSNRYETVFGQSTFPNLAAIGKPIDAVFSLMGAERTTELVEEAAKNDAGGVITIASGFSEYDSNGVKLQERIKAAAWDALMPIIGPNGIGYINIPRKLDLTLLTPFPHRAGGVSMIAHSGATIAATAAAAWRVGGIGFNLLISAGNEPVTDMADYVEYLIDDPNTKIICLVVEKIRRPGAFFAAAARARRAGKPVIAVKLARTSRTQRIALSHTGSLTGDAWVYEQAFKQAGILRADDVEEMVDRVQLLDQLPTSQWSPVRGLFVLAASGGFAAVTADVAEAEGLDVPEAEHLAEWIGTVMPGVTVSNPLDTTGLLRPETLENVIRVCLSAPEFDTNIFMSQFADWYAATGSVAASAESFARISREAGGKATVISPFAGNAGKWLERLQPEYGVAIGNGLRGSLRGLSAMAAFVRSRPDMAVNDPADVPDIAKPGAPLVMSESGPMLPFAAGMDLLRAAGIPTAPYHLVAGSDDAIDVPFAGPYVVKLADVSHRTEHDAVRLGVASDDLPSAVASLRALARRDDLPDLVAVQQMISSYGEAFIGIRGQSELGPVVAFGPGGIFVEVLGKTSGRMAPFTTADALELIAEFDSIGAFNGLRGRRPWDRETLASILCNASLLAAGGRKWIETLDINPVILGSDGVVAVDILCLVREESSA